MTGENLYWMYCRYSALHNNCSNDEWESLPMEEKQVWMAMADEINQNGV